MKDVLISYLKAFISNEEINLNVTNEKEFYELVSSNGLSAIIFNVLKKENISDKLYQALHKDFLGYVSKDIRQKAVIKRIKTIFNENKIKHLFLKGAHLKEIYSESYYRGMGDIDVLVNKEDLNLVVKVFKENNIKLTSTSISHHVFIDESGLDIEVHPFLYTDLDKYKDLLKDPFKYASVSNNYSYKFNPTYELLYLIFHLEKHLISGGIGLRSVLDIGIFIKHYEIDEKLLIDLASNNIKFVKTIIALNKYLFNIDSNLIFMESAEIKEKTLDDLTNYIIKSGIHGVGSDHNEFSSRVTKKGSRFKFLLSRLFPSVTEMRGFYPSLNKLSILLPFYYVARVFKVLVIDLKNNINKLRKTTKVSNVKDIKKLFNEIGIL